MTSSEPHDNIVTNDSSTIDTSKHDQDTKSDTDDNDSLDNDPQEETNMMEYDLNDTG